MFNLEHHACLNEKYSNYGKHGVGNIAVRTTYGVKKDRTLLYCKTCGLRFSATRGSALEGIHIPAERVKVIIHLASLGNGVRSISNILDMNAATVNRIILKVGQKCALMLSTLLSSLELTEIQLDELWAFIKKNEL
jgi:transposase-like protein